VADALEWPIEDIPDGDSLFMRAHRAHIRNGEVDAGVFRSHEGGMSANWNKYATAAETRQQATRNPNDNAVIRLSVGGIRQVGDLKVEHTPQPSNRAHSEVFGIPEERSKLTQTRVLLRRLIEIALPLP
jgi:hypothetical protein